MDYAIPRKVLDLVAHLHARGYQRIRIEPGMSPSGAHWRCCIVAVGMPRDYHACYSSASGDRYFGWEDGGGLDPAQLADRFIARFPAIAAAGRGADAAYVQWYADMLRLTRADAFPIAFADYPLPEGRLTTVGARCVDLPLPPPPKAV